VLSLGVMVLLQGTMVLFQGVMVLLQGIMVLLQGIMVLLAVELCPSVCMLPSVRTLLTRYKWVISNICEHGCPPEMFIVSPQRSSV
jgi:hypothetical protein